MGPAIQTLYAIWVLKPFNVVFDKNNTNATGVMSPQNISYSSSVRLTKNSFQNTGWKFGGWAESPNGSITYNDTAMYTMGPGNDTLYAVWSAHNYEVTFDAQGGTAPANPASKTITSPQTTLGRLPEPPQKFGYCFDGWYSQPNGAGVEFLPISVISSDIILYCKWSVPLVDPDGNQYSTLRIGNQTWMVENYRSTSFRDGSPITRVEDNAEWSKDTVRAAYCWYGNDSITYRENCGALYNWYAATSTFIAPAGWHLPTEAEWKALRDYLIANGYNWDGTTTGNKIAKSLASQGGWKISSEQGMVGTNTSLNNTSGFNGYPAGYRMDWSGEFWTYTLEAIWWYKDVSNIEDSRGAFFLTYENYPGLSSAVESEQEGASVRFIRSD
jgi:uncharacterized protein (TIGR02145 family)